MSTQSENRPGTSATVWSVLVKDLGTGDILLSEDVDRVCETASIGKIFLLIDVACRIESGTLSPTDPIQIPDEHRVEESGILYRFVRQGIPVADAALLVGAFSDNLATNALIHMCGLDAVNGVASELGYTDTALLDYIRDEARTPDMPFAASCGTARELVDVMARLHAGTVVSAQVSERVLGWLASDADTSMVADSFALDPLAHIDPEYQGMVLRHKTGTTDVVRADVGVVAGPQATVAYAVLANWRSAGTDQRVVVMDRMRTIGEQIRAHVTGVQRDEGGTL